MSVHVTNEQASIGVTSTPVVLRLTNNTTVNALKVQAWEFSEGDVYEISLHYEDATTNIWVDESTIVNVSFPASEGDAITWFTDPNGAFYYWQNGSFHYADGNQYFGDTTNFEIANNTVNNTISESWSFSLVYEVSSEFVYRPITKAIKITNTGTLVIKYYRGTIEIFPELVEEVIPPSIYKTDSIKIVSGQNFDARAYPGLMAGISIALYQQRSRRLPDGTRQNAGSVSCVWYNGENVRNTQIWARNEVINFNAEGGQESIEKDFVVTPMGGSEVEIRVRTLHYPIVAASGTSTSDPDFDALAEAVNMA